MVPHLKSGTSIIELTNSIYDYLHPEESEPQENLQERLEEIAENESFQQTISGIFGTVKIA